MSEFMSKVDCVAYSAIDIYDKPIGEPDNMKINEVMASCSHPKRHGPIFGCLLVDFNTGKSILGASCPFVTHKGSAEATELKKLIEEQENHSNPF